MDSDYSGMDANFRMRMTLEDPQLSRIRQRPASAGRGRPRSARTTSASSRSSLRMSTPQRAQKPQPGRRSEGLPPAIHSRSASVQQADREKSTRTCAWPRAARFTKTPKTNEEQPHTVGKALDFRPRLRSEEQRWQWEQWSGTQLSGECGATVPKPVAKAIQKEWQRHARSGVKYLIIFETCHHCEEHSMTTRHCPGSYEAYRKESKKFIEQEFPFIKCVNLEESEGFIVAGGAARRIGAFEVYFFCPNLSKQSKDSWQHLLLHSKLCTKRWPLIEALLERLRDALPEIVRRAPELLQEEWTEHHQIELESAIRDAEAWGLGTLDVIEELRNKKTSFIDWREESKQAQVTGDTEAMRNAVRRGSDFAGDVTNSATIAELRGNLKKHNMIFLNIKSLAKKFQRNSEFVAAARLIETCQVRPLRLETLQEAKEKAQAAGIDQEDLEAVEELHSAVEDIVYSVTSVLEAEARDLADLARGLERGLQLRVKHATLDTGLREISNTASQLQRATESFDLVELTNTLKYWQVPSESVKLGVWSRGALAPFLAAEAKRAKLQARVNEAERRYNACEWDALQRICKDELADAHIEAEQWDKWMATLERERHFTLMKAVSGVGIEFKRRMHARRLETILKSQSVPIVQLQDVADTAEMHHVDKSLIEKARDKITSFKSRLANAEDAMRRKHVDTAEAVFFKLSGGISEEEIRERSERLYEMAHAVKVADEVQDFEMMKDAIDGWKEERPGVSNVAFEREDSPTAAFRYACVRIKELQIISLRRKLGSLVDSISKHYGAMDDDSSAALKETVCVARDLMDLGWEMTTPKKAHLLQLAEIIKAHKTGMDALRFGAMLFRTCGSEHPSARIVFMVDQSGTSTPDFSNYVAPALTLIIEGISKRANDLHMGALAYNPVTKIQDLTQSSNTFKANVSKHTCSKGKPFPVEKALRKAYDIMKDKDPSKKDRDCLRIIFNFTSSSVENAKEAHKVFLQLDSKAVLIVSIAIGALPNEDILQEFSSPGLVFKVGQAAQLSKFVADAFESMARVESRAGSFSPEETLDALRSL